MRHLMPLVAILAMLLAGCASTDGKTTEPPAESAAMPSPQSIYVYDFAVSPADVSPGGAAATQLAGAVDDPDKNEKREALEHKIAETLSLKLVADLQKAGLPAVRWSGTPPKNKDAYILEGQFLTTDESGARKIVGFSLNGAELRILTQLYRVDRGRKYLFTEADVGDGTAKPGLAGKLPVTKLSASKAASSVSTGVGAVRDITTKVKKAAEETATAIVELLKPKMEEQGWF